MRVQDPGRDGRAAERSTRHSAPTAPDRLAKVASDGAGPVHLPGAFSPQGLLALQRTVGNQAVAAMLADRHARDKGHAPAGDHVHGGPVQRAATGNRAQEEPVRRAAAHTVLRSAGRPLEAPLRTEMEARLGADFSSVRLHTGDAARRSAQELGARAYTSGENVVIGAGGTDKHTLAHELTHVIQQRQGPVSGTDNGAGVRVSDPSDHFERAAEANARRAMAAPLPSAHRTGDDGHTDLAGSLSRSVRHPGEAGTPAVQRAVGFEFEAQWNVRRMEANSQEVREQRSQERQRLIDARILEIFLSPYSPYHRRLTPQEQTQVAQGGDQALRAQWFDHAGFLTSAGAQRLEGLDVTADERQSLVTTLMVRGQVSEEPLAGENLGKGRVDGLVVAGNKFDLTADASPTGGSNLEWITDPLTSLAEVGTVMDNVTAMARFLDGRQNSEYIRSEEVTAGGGTPRPNLRIYPDGNALSFAPQATLGARLERLPKLIDYLENRRPLSVLERVPVLGAGRVKGRRQASADLSAGGLGDLPVARAGADAAIAALLPQLGFPLSGAETKALTGLVMHLAAYLIQGQNLQPGANAKSIAGALMARTDFAHSFSLLPANLTGHFQANPDAFAALVLQGANMTGHGEERVFGNEVERGLANDRTRTTVELTRNAWLRALPSGSDLLKNWEHLTDAERNTVDDEDGARAVHKSLGALGAQQNLVGPQADQEAVVAELRRMKDNIPTARLKPLAVAVFTLVEQLNAQRTLRYEKGL
ncbi:eCIS core domain-containing protein [Streptomyces broussonetiae]|uniref:eCIS core domain-containing protein n=1 Tax=Streptomyces broussonetiae TaxID=2686304 RepID=UPI0035D996F6